MHGAHMIVPAAPPRLPSLTPTAPRLMLISPTTTTAASSHAHRGMAWGWRLLQRPAHPPIFTQAVAKKKHCPHPSLAFTCCNHRAAQEPGSPRQGVGQGQKLQSLCPKASLLGLHPYSACDPSRRITVTNSQLKVTFTVLNRRIEES